MNHSTLLLASQGLHVPMGLLHMTSDQTRRMAIYHDKDGNFVIAFFQTLGPWNGPDWLANIRAWKKGLTVGSRKYFAHAGFVDEYLTHRETILRHLRIYQPSTVWVTGFSQGGAHAVLCARDIIANFKAMAVNLVTFGAPRVYDTRGAQEFDLTIANSPNCSATRYERDADPVPGLPPWWLDYQHVGHRVRLDRFPWIFANPARHDPTAYIKALEAIEGATS